MIEQINAILSAFVLLLGGAFIIFIYDAYRKTKQRTLLLFAIGLFIIIIGGASPGFLLSLGCDKINPLITQAISLSIQIPGILIMIYSALKG
ncbi:MAG: hypothetical protein KAT65_25910 [Methanophagales archaeon]|nr:hypothetical protein [Methanophagales archaeon]